jgi:hypothetical protein
MLKNGLGAAARVGPLVHSHLTQRARKLKNFFEPVTMPMPSPNFFRTFSIRTGLAVG